MKLNWLAQRGAPQLLLFFNGWGMDERVVAHLAPPAGCDLLEVHGYADRDGAPLERVLAGYGSFVLVAWSFGVWAAAVVLAAVRRVPAVAVAINGTCRPIDAEYGIPPQLYRATLERFSAPALDSFTRRMCGGPEALAHYRARASRRSLDDQGDELRALAADVPATPVPASPFTRAIVGSADRIVPPRHQSRCWEGAAATSVLPLPHYPFCALERWEQILGVGGR
jgi:hypothetical protein